MTDLVNGYLNKDQTPDLKDKAMGWPRIVMNARQLSDAHMVAQGGFSPITGFMTQTDYKTVVNHMHLSDGSPWSLPVTLGVNSDVALSVKEGQNVCLTKDDGNIAGILQLEEKYQRDKLQEATLVYGTTDSDHPGVANLYLDGDVLLAGKLLLIDDRPELEEGCSKYYMTPTETRMAISKMGWSTVVGFQTRNPLHRAHEYIQKCALEIVDGLLLHPLVGDTKSDDIPASTRMRCYEVLIDKYYPPERVILSVLPAFMRYAGPREAILHALIRKNYGCTHFIVGRDHAGVGNYYGPYDAHHIFSEFDAHELGITPVFFNDAFYCYQCGGMASEKTCPHNHDDRLSLSGTQIREMLVRGETLPEELTRPEVARILTDESRTWSRL